MKRIIWILLLAAMGWQATAQTVETGIEVLRGNNFEQLKGKRIGLITNPSGIDRNFRSTIDILNNAEGVTLAALFSPEHGVRGNEHAAQKVASYLDEQTGVPVYSLFGNTYRPTPEMLQGLDAIVYDIQDIGARSYTFVSTMGLMMEAAAANNLEFIVLDRPNPLGGEKVEGCLTEDGFISFVSQFKIPYIYGLTPGELASMLNQEHMLAAQCRLTVVPMKGWRRSMTYEETGQPWILPSPHIPQTTSALLYPATGILGDLNMVSIGVGYTLPFQIIASERIPAEQLADSLNALHLEGLNFRPIYLKPYYSFGKDRELQGVQIHITDYSKAVITDIQFWAIQEMHKIDPRLDFFGQCGAKRVAAWDAVCGTNYISKTFGKRYKFEDVKAYWHKDDSAFKERSKRYYLYQ